MICTEAINTVVKTRDPSGIVIVLVLDIKDVWVEACDTTEVPTSFVLEEL